MKDRVIQLGEKTFSISATDQSVSIQINKKSHSFPCPSSKNGKSTKSFTQTEIGGRLVHLFIEKSGDRRILTWPGGNIEITTVPWQSNSNASDGSLQPLKLTMPGKVLKINVKAGDLIKQGDCIAVVEAMKMENNLLATADAKIKQIHASEGDRLDAGANLVSFEAAETAE